MTLPARSHYSLSEVAARWDRSLKDIIGWAAAGKLKVVTVLPLAFSEGKPIAGEVEVNGKDLLQMVIRKTQGLTSARVYRVRAIESLSPEEWIFINDKDGSQGVEISQDDLYLTQEEMVRFQDQHELVRVVEKIVYRAATKDKHDWEAMYVRFCKRIFEEGLPEHLQEITTEMQEWFIGRSKDGDAPDISTIRKRLQPFWNELRGAT